MSSQPLHVTDWLRPLGVGELLDVAIKAYRARFATMVKAVVVVIVPVMALSAVVELSLLPDGSEAMADPSAFSDPTMTPTVDLGNLWAIVAGTLLVGLLSMIASQLATGASLRVVSAAYLGGEPRWQDSLRFAWSRLGSLVWLTILIVLFMFLVGVAAAIAAFAAPATPLQVMAVVAAVALAIYFLVTWSVAVPVLLLEHRRGRAALKRSRRLVSGRWWPALAVTVLAYLLLVVLQVVLSGVLSALVLSRADEVVAVAGQSVIEVASNAVSTPFLAAVNTVLYFDLRVRKEGFDLELLARRVGVDPRAATGADPASSPPDRPSDAPVLAAPAYGTAESRASSGTGHAGTEQAFTTVPAYEATARRWGPFHPPAVGGAQEATEPTPPEPHDDDSTAVRRTPVYDPAARRSTLLQPAGASSQGSPHVRPTATASSSAGYEPFPYRTTTMGAADAKVSTVVAGVFVGLWLFVLSLFLVGVLLGSLSVDSLRGATTTTTSLLPTPTSIP